MLGYHWKICLIMSMDLPFDRLAFQGLVEIGKEFRHLGKVFNIN